MIIKNQHYTMVINDNDGSLESFSNKTKEFICYQKEKRPIFTVRLRDHEGNSIDLSAHHARQFSIKSGSDGGKTNIKMYFGTLGDLPVHVEVSVLCMDDNPFTYWNLTVEQDTDYYIEWIDFPNVIVPNDLIATGGQGRIIWPFMEGALIEDTDIRENSGWSYKPIEYPSKGVEGCYPGPCQSQFMAYYDNKGGLYFGAHDEENNIKAIEFYKYDEGIRLEFRLFPGAIHRRKYRMEYDMVLGLFYGDWYNAADIYRNWYESSKMQKPVKFFENATLPEWIKESPVVVTYPVRGEKDTGDMKPNEYYPYINALQHIDKLSKAFDSKILVLLMHWEGTAPWAPPYVWPPYGGEEIFKEFVNELHKEGNLLGVYCSGIAWTDESVLVPEYNRKKQFEEQNLSEIMCTSPKGELPHSLICNGPIRWGYDMCPTNQFVKDVVLNEVAKIVESGCDYIQYFDQNTGGNSYFCYSKKHGHPPVPGKWQNDAMINIFKKLNELIYASGRKVVLGCEAAAAEPFIPYLMFNDLRFNLNFHIGRPIPVYSYIYHEYVNNFMGNQVCTSWAINREESPDNLLYRIAYSFSAGDMMTVVLKNNGEVNWDWGSDWDSLKPNQEEIALLVKNLNAWRKNIAKTFLCFGRMEKPYSIKDIYSKELSLCNGSKLSIPSLVTSRWISPEGREAQIIINYTGKVQEFTIELNGLTGRDIKVYYDADGRRTELTKAYEEDVKLKIEPLSALMIEMM